MEALDVNSARSIESMPCIGRYPQGRYNLYDFVGDNPSNRVEPYSWWLGLFVLALLPDPFLDAPESPSQSDQPGNFTPWTPGPYEGPTNSDSGTITVLSPDFSNIPLTLPVGDGGNYAAFLLSAIAPEAGLLGKSFFIRPVCALPEEGISVTIRNGEIVSRLWDSNYTPGSPFSGPFGRFFSPGGYLPISADEGIAARGLNLPGMANNAQRGALYQATRDIPAMLRPATGGDGEMELEIERMNIQHFRQIPESVSNIPPAGSP